MCALWQTQTYRDGFTHTQKSVALSVNSVTSAGVVRHTREFVKSKGTKLLRVVHCVQALFQYTGEQNER